MVMFFKWAKKLSADWATFVCPIGAETKNRPKIAQTGSSGFNEKQCDQMLELKYLNSFQKSSKQ